MNTEQVKDEPGSKPIRVKTSLWKLLRARADRIMQRRGLQSYTLPQYLSEASEALEEKLKND